MFQTKVEPLRWVGDIESGHLEMLDQRLLPAQEYWHVMTTARDVADGIRDMIIRGAPAIGIAAAFGMALGLREFCAASNGQSRHQYVTALRDLLAQTRPTAVNLFWALKRCQEVVERNENNDHNALVKALFVEATSIFEEDKANNHQMGLYGAELFSSGARILTHCNTGGLATGGYGTALGIIRACFAQDKLAHIWVDETRPYLQGARLTAWECVKEGMPATLVTDNMAAHLMKLGQVDAVIVGTDRVAANGDMANKIGSYGLAVLCKYHGIPFYVAAPLSTIDMNTLDGDAIPIEERNAREVTHIGNYAIAPGEIAVAHPAFDVTPAELISAIITEKGVLRYPYTQSLPTLG